MALVIQEIKKAGEQFSIYSGGHDYEASRPLSMFS